MPDRKRRKIRVRRLRSRNRPLDLCFAGLFMDYHRNCSHAMVAQAIAYRVQSDSGLPGWGSSRASQRDLPIT
jgi:hypothetical protein